MIRKLLALCLTMLLPLAALADGEVVERLIVIKNGRFEPAIVEVPAGKKIRLVVRNEGPGPEEFESTPLRKETVLAEGVTRKVIIAPQDPGEYAFFGEFHMDTAKGKLVVK
ncbi:MAG: cupredoxin domain-containing protein [Gammaproteobacteria bacterium]|nr:cupredoxin domain-containing protein [Gammaproteobacteria bacterium]